jgi:CHASE3 domain sensor protein
MDLSVFLILAIGVFLMLGASLATFFVALKTKETADAILAELRRGRHG